MVKNSPQTGKHHGLVLDLFVVNECLSLKNAGVSQTNIFEELPIVIHNSHLAEAFLYELDEKIRVPSFDILDPSRKPYLEKHLELTIDCLDDVSTELNKFYFHQRNITRQQQQQAAYLQRKVLDAF